MIYGKVKGQRGEEMIEKYSERGRGNVFIRRRERMEGEKEERKGGRGKHRRRERELINEGQTVRTSKMCKKIIAKTKLREGDREDVA